MSNTKVSIRINRWRGTVHRTTGPFWGVIIASTVDGRTTYLGAKAPVATTADWEAAGAPEAAVAFACVGRWLPDCRDAFGRGKGPGPCNYTGGGLFALNPVRVATPDGKHHNVFDFAPEAAPEAVDGG